jgi:DNA-binding NarL/FixJ family response regulator
VRKLKEQGAALQVIMLTVYENSDRIFEALAAGACGYLVKSTPPEKLIEAIQDVWNGGSPMSSHIARKVVQAFQSPTPEASPKEHLAPREEQVLELLSKGRAYKQIAGDMNLHIGTVRTYIRRIYEKLHVNCRTDAVVKYLETAGGHPRSPRP